MKVPAGSLPGAVVMGLSPTGLHVVRTLGRAGVKVIGVADGFQPGSVSRYLSKCVTAPSAHEKLSALFSLAPETPQSEAGRPVLIPTSDQDIDILVSHADALSRRYNFQKSYSDGTASKILAKDSFYDLCSEYGIPFPGVWTAEPAELAAVLSKALLPCMVKPSLIHSIKEEMRGKKGWVIKEPSEIDGVLSSIPTEAGRLIVQEIIPGPESLITIACAHVSEQGELLQTFTGRKLRQYPPGFGSASLVQSSPEPESAALMSRFLKAVNYAGIAAAEFKRHPQTGQLHIIEVNVRPSLWFSLTEASGRSVVRSLYEELGAALPLRPADEQQDGVRWRYWVKDTWSSLFYRRNPDYFLGAPDTNAVGSALRHTAAVFSADDPLPALADIANFALKGFLRRR